MNWFFVNAGQQAGPISDLQLDEYILAGKILPDTLIWREGMQNWQPCQEVKSTLTHKTLPSAPTRPALNSTGETVLEIVCAECGGLQPRENAIKQGDRWICAACKPIHIQKIREGLVEKTVASMEYAGLLIRALAKFLDGLIIGLPAILLIFFVFAVALPPFAKNRANENLVVLVVVGTIGVVAFAMVFFQIWCLPKYGGTPGKRILGLRVVTADGGDISWGRAIGRFFGEWVSGMIPLWIGYLIAGFDPERRTVHDHIAGTRVIKV
jgi:uncharacterized RDD family membrane protein YckC